MTNQTPLKKEEELEKKLTEISSKREEEEYESNAKDLGLPFARYGTIPIDTDALAIIDEKDARSAKIAILRRVGSKLTVGAIDPEAEETTKRLETLKKTGFSVDLIVVSPSSLEKIWERYKDVRKAEVFEVGAIEIKEEEIDSLQKQINDIGDLKKKVSQVSATKLLEILAAGALKIGASDIHFEPEAEKTRLRYRLDGLLNDVTFISKDDYLKLLNRIKVISKLKLNIHNAPQDGRFTIRQKSADIEVRVSVLPGEFGETVVMRLLDPRTIRQKLEELGMREDLLREVRSQLNKSTGAILTTGPTGSGKTTTLYAFTNYLNSPGTKIITIEDPIEYHIKGISQTQVDPSKGYSFANGLRAIVRQDPDIVLVGEIRDAETAEIALHAALTGHLVLSTIHTNNAAGTIPRLIDLGIKPQIIAPAISMAMAQRLVRKLCSHCKIAESVKTDDLKKIKQAIGALESKYKLPALNESLKIYYPGKCKECNETGYKGRIGVFEAFIMSREMEKLILKSPAISEIEELATKEGMVSMLQDAYLKLLDGITSLEEIERILI